MCLSKYLGRLTVKTHILFVVELAIAEMACVSSNVRRTFHVPSGGRVQRSISERDVSHPRYSNSKKQKRRPLPETSAERYTFLPAFRSSNSFLTAFSRIIGIKFWWFSYPCYDGAIAKAMDYTSKGELL